MNRKQLLEQLIELFSQIAITSKCVNELIDLTVGSGKETKFLALFRTRILRLLELGISAIHDKEFESLGDHLFSMHLSGSGFNIRILYAFLPDQSPILLLAFYERAGKNKTDYSTYIPAARSRYDEELEVFNNEQ